MEEARSLLDVRGDNDQGGSSEHFEVTYLPARKTIRALVYLVALLLLGLLVFSQVFALHLIGVAGFITILVFLVETFATTSIVLEPDRIVKRRIFFGDTVVPSRRAVVTMDQQTIRFYHCSTANRRERITVRLGMISPRDAQSIVSYIDRIYGIKLAAVKTEQGESPAREGSGSGKGRKISPILLEEYKKTLKTYRFALGLMITLFAVTVIAIGASDNFTGMAPALPAFWVRLALIVLALGAYPLLKKFNPADASLTDSSSPRKITDLPWNLRFKGLEDNSTISALLVAFTVSLGFVAFLLFGNILDFYVFLIVATVYYLDFYPRLSVWERLSEGRRLRDSEAGVASPMDAPSPRRRSLQVSLAVMGALAMTSYGQSNNYLYKSKKDCLDDWGSEQSCVEPPPGSSHYRTGYYYGPRYGTYTRTGSRSIGAVSVSRGGFGSLGSFHSSFGG